jgi:hypothetical protein
MTINRTYKFSAICIRYKMDLSIIKITAPIAYLSFVKFRKLLLHKYMAML